MYTRLFTFIFCCILFVSCGTTKNTTLKKSNAAASNVIKKHYNTQLKFETLSGKMRALYADEDKTQSVSLSFRIEKDKAIWISAQVLGFPLAKAYITPNKVSYYEKIGKTYFEGDFSLLSKWLGTPLDFQKLQNLLIGQAIYDLREEAYHFTQTARGFQFTPSEETNIKRMFLLNPKTYKAQAQQLAEETKNRSVTITYSNYQEIEGELFPEEIKIIANEGGKSTNIELRYRSVDLNKELSFPFHIPSGYDEIILE